MTQQIIGKLLQGRYKIVQSLGAGVFGKTYIAIDTTQPNSCQYVVKQLKISSFHPSYLQILRLNFFNETEILKRLGKHEQIPEFITYFEENEGFYLVQELIDGHALTFELPVAQTLGTLWNESKVIKFLQDVLGILEFVHSQGVIHCDVKPDNLIRRACDGKLFLIDFGSTQAINFGLDAVLSIYQVPATSLGYIPPEQFIGQTQPNSDIYALGMIAIQALTGLSPLQLQIDPHRNEMIWHSQQITVSDYLAAILSQMIRYNYQERFQSATEVLQALKQMTIDNKRSQLALAESSSLSETSADEKFQGSLSSPLLTGVKVGLAVNSLVIGLGVYSLINNSPGYLETQTLHQATKKYQAGDLEAAITLAKTIPANSNVYFEAQATIEKWQNQWQAATEQLVMAEKALDEDRWSDVFRVTSQLPKNSYWQSKADKIIEQAKAKMETQTYKLLTKAYAKADVKDFNTALKYLRNIPKESSATTLVQQKLVEYKHKQQVRAIYLLQQAYDQAAVSKFDTAIEFLQQIPENTDVYAVAQMKLIEYGQKQRLQTARQNLTKSTKSTATQIRKKLIQERANRKLQSFNIVSNLQEVNIMLPTNL